MLTLVEIRTAAGLMLSLPLTNSDNGFWIKDFDGLDPVKATIVTSSFAGMDGQQYQSARRESRNLLPKLGLDPNEGTVRDLRKRLYSFLMPKAQVSLRFYMLDGLTVDISGRVESLDTELFAKEPEANISIICFDPDFYDPVPVEVTGMYTSDVDPRIITYTGTVETGVVMTLNVNRSVDAFAIYHLPPNDELQILEFSAALVAGDVVEISTVQGNKYARLTREGTQSSILYAVSPQSKWIELQPGVNELRVEAEGDAIPVSFEYLNKYGGL